jgi:guanine nucleotide-binding protein subunit alpha
MGCGMSTEDKEGKARNEEIENQLKRDKMLQRNEIKMLLLGMIKPGYNPERKSAMAVMIRDWVRKLVR